MTTLVIAWLKFSAPIETRLGSIGGLGFKRRIATTLYYRLHGLNNRLIRRYI